jgi:hypothetical protein
MRGKGCVAVAAVEEMVGGGGKVGRNVTRKRL